MDNELETLADEIRDKAGRILDVERQHMHNYCNVPYLVYRDDRIVIEREAIAKHPMMYILKATEWEEREIGYFGRKYILLETFDSYWRNEMSPLQFHPGPWCDYLKNKCEEILSKIPMEVEEKEDTRWEPTDY